MTTLHRRVYRRDAFCILMAFSFSAMPLQTLAQGPFSAGNGVTYGGGLTVLALATDNYFYSTTDSLATQGYSLAPRLDLGYTQNTLQAKLFINATYLQWQEIPNNLGDIFDYGAVTSLLWTPSYRHRFGLDAAYRHGHDEAGSVRTETLLTRFFSDGLDEWKDSRAKLRYRFGGDNARANSELSYQVQERRYLTNREDTTQLDYESDNANYTLFYNYSPKTAWALSVDRLSTRFAEPSLSTVNRDAVEYRLLTGIRWKATAKTAGSVRAGYYSREAADRANPSHGFDWQAEVRWDPLATTAVELRTGRASEVSYRTDTRFNDDRSASLAWKQIWTGRLKTNASFNYLNSEFVDAQINDRIRNTGLEAEYSVHPRATLLFGVHYMTRGSNQHERSYDTLRGEFGINLKL